MRKNLYLFGSAALGTLLLIYGYFVMNGEIPSEISIMDPNTQLIGLALFFNSVMIQRKYVKGSNQAKEEAEMQKEITKQQKIANDKHGRGRFIAPDILTQAAIEERQQQHNENYNLNQNRFR